MSKEVLTRFEAGQRAAHEALSQGAMLADEPAVFYDENSRVLSGQLEVSFDTIVNFSAERFGVDRVDLNSMAVCFYDRTHNGTNKERISGCHTTGEPLALGSHRTLHFPVVAVEVNFSREGEFSPRASGLGALNLELRHQLAHVFEPNVTPFVEKSGAFVGARVASAISGAGFAAMAGLGLRYGFDVFEAATIVGAAGTTTVSASEQVMGRMLHAISLREYKADWFAAKNYGFHPITRA